jgi:hypothetical protein
MRTKKQNKIGVWGGRRGRSATGAVRSRYTGQSERRVGEMSIEACGLVIRSSISGTLYTLSTCSGPWSRGWCTACFRDSKSEIFELLRAYAKTITTPHFTNSVTHVISPFFWNTSPRGWVIVQMSIKLGIRTLKMGQQRFPESSDTKSPVTPCSFPKPRKTQLCSCENPKITYCLTSLFAPYLTTLSPSEVL